MRSTSADRLHYVSARLTSLSTKHLGVVVCRFVVATIYFHSKNRERSLSAK
jgi:hypothetical protein